MATDINTNKNNNAKRIEMLMYIKQLVANPLKWNNNSNNDDDEFSFL